MKTFLFRLSTFLASCLLFLYSQAPATFASNTSVAGLQTGADWLRQAEGYHAKNQFELAAIYYLQALRLEPGSREILTLKEAAERQIGSGSASESHTEPANYRAEVLSFLERLESLFNLHSMPALSAMYAADYVNNDGYYRNELLDNFAALWKMYPNAKTSFTSKNVSIDGNFATVECVQTTSGLTGEPIMNVGFVRTVSQAKGKIFLERQEGGWIIVAVRTDNQQERDDCGSAVNMPMMLVAPAVCESGSNYSAQVQGSFPLTCSCLVSVTNMLLQNPPVKPPDDFHPLTGAGFARVFNANKKCRNELVAANVTLFAQVGGTRAPVGVCRMSQRVNVVPPATVQSDQNVLRRAVQSALAKISPSVQAGVRTENQVPSPAVDRPLHKPDAPVKDKWALVIGISHFANPAYNLKYAAKDARDFYNYLIHEGAFRPDHVLLLLDEKATKLNIMEAFGEKFLPAVTEDGDLVVVFVSTHGTPAIHDRGGRNYIAAFDTDVDKLYGTGVDMDEINRRIKESVKSDRVLIVLDTCYSGGGVPGAKGMYHVGNLDAEAMASGSGHLVISSSSPAERSFESKVSPNGVFTKYLLEALRKNGAKEDVKTAFQELKKNVSWEVKSAYGESQTPRLGGDWQGRELILSVPAAEPRTVFNQDLLEMMSSGGRK